MSKFTSYWKIISKITPTKIDRLHYIKLVDYIK